MYPRIGQFKTVEDFRRRLAELGLDLPVDERILTASNDSPLARRLEIAGLTIGNRWCIHPMEGWDARRDGNPSELTERRWFRFGESGAKLIWGGEAVAISHDGRANPNQLLASPQTQAGLRHLLNTVETAHRQRFGTSTDLLIGLQLTHSGRFSRPDGECLQPRIMYHHPLLDRKFGIEPFDNSIIWTDSELEQLMNDYVSAARIAADVGFQFVDIKACHGYLIHEALSAFHRPGRFGGDFEGRTRLLLGIIDRVRDQLPQLSIAVRLSVFDTPPFEALGTSGRAMPCDDLLPYAYGFGLDLNSPLVIDLREPIELARQLRARGVRLLNISCGSPYYNPHLQRPAAFPPSDGYWPPEDPLVSVCRQVDAARRIKEAVSDVLIVGSGYSYLQDFLPQVAQAVVRAGWTDCVGLGRMALSYPELPGDTLSGAPIQRRRICRTFSDCTTAPRNGLVSGCYPLDPFYKESKAAETLRQIKRRTT